MKGSFKLDSRKWNSAVRQLAAVGGSKPVQQVMRQAAGQVVKRVVSVTPPSKGEANKQAQVHGEAVILGDISKIAVPTVVEGGGRRGREALAAFAELVSVYKAARSHSDGRVNPRSRKQKLNVSPADFNRLLKQAQRLVGTLASGWNAAAEQLGVHLPAWIKRHGTKHGEIRITITSHGIRIFLANKVGFVDNIPDLQRRLQWALDVVAKSIIERQLPNAIKSVARKAGFKAR